MLCDLRITQLKKKSLKSIYTVYIYVGLLKETLKSVVDPSSSLKKSAKLVLKKSISPSSPRLWTKYCTVECRRAEVTRAGKDHGIAKWISLPPFLFMQSSLQLTPKKKKNARVEMFTESVFSKVTKGKKRRSSGIEGFRKHDSLAAKWERW